MRLTGLWGRLKEILCGGTEPTEAVLSVISVWLGFYLVDRDMTAYRALSALRGFFVPGEIIGAALMVVGVFQGIALLYRALRWQYLLMGAASFLWIFIAVVIARSDYHAPTAPMGVALAFAACWLWWRKTTGACHGDKR